MCAEYVRNCSECIDKEVKIKHMAMTIEFLQEKIKSYQQTVKELDERNKETFQLIHSLSLERTKSSTSILNGTNNINYVTNNFNSAPPIVKHDLLELKKVANRPQYIETFAAWEVNKTIAKRISDMIVGKYKTSDPENQSLWTTDVSRFNYVIREIVNKKLMWSVDKGAVKTCGYILNPVLAFLKKILKKWISEFSEMNPEDQFNDEYLEPINNIIEYIENGNLKKQILKIVSPHFAIDNNQGCFSASSNNNVRKVVNKVNCKDISVVENNDKNSDHDTDDNIDHDNDNDVISEI